jgi:hypothetical protein
MEGIQTINALKAVVSSLPAQTTIPSSELVMLYAADGTPIAKIARDDLVKAVASVMASNSQNTFSKLLGVQANGTPMGIGASDLASVLGVVYKKDITYNVDDVDNVRDAGIYCSYKDGIGVTGLLVFSYAVSSFMVQLEIRQARGIRYRTSYSGGSSWNEWIDYPIPQ